MNYLAHAFLSFNEPEILVGNMISDFVKGKKKFDFPDNVQKGIALHRHIDQFTDDHPANKEAKEFFRPAYRLYAGAFVDVLYDHFLANDETQFPGENSLKDFTQKVYNELNRHYEILPQRFQKMLPYMEQQDWLYNYQFAWGLERSFEGLRRRAVYIHETTSAVDVFNVQKPALKSCYDLFFPELKKFSKEQLRNLLDR